MVGVGGMVDWEDIKNAGTGEKMKEGKGKKEHIAQK